MKSNPKFNNARGVGSTLQLKPPFVFKGVTVSVFPLRASLPRLQGFCEAHLNVTPTDKFEPFIPSVYLMLVDYGQMSAKAADMGWVSQREVAFAIPLRWSRWERGAWRFHDWALHCPFIFVDNELSMTTGREVFGWPKMMAQLEPSIDEWISDPHGKRQVFKVSAKLFEHNYQGRESEYRPFLEVHHTPVPSLLDIPPDLSELFRPLARTPNIIMNAARMGADLLETFGSIALGAASGSSDLSDLLEAEFYDKQISRGRREWLDPNAWQRGLKAIGGSLAPRQGLSTINFKQFRDAADPLTACYQAITNAAMGVENINRGGLLGPQNLMLGKQDGGYRIALRHFDSLPIVDTLGLEVDEKRMDGTTPVASLRPVFPFWYDCDMTYGAGEVITWRTRSDGWQNGDIEKAPEYECAGHPLTADGWMGKPSTKKEQESPVFSNARGPTTEAMSGPFNLPDTTVRVLPLLANEETLSKFVADYLDIDEYAKFEAWGPYVYMIVSNYANKSSEVNTIGMFSNREINFAVPVKWYDYGPPEQQWIDWYKCCRPEPKLRGVALLNAFSYVDDESVAIVNTEVEGTPTFNAELASPPHRWMQTQGPALTNGDVFVDTTAYVLPALGVGAGGSYQTFLRVSTDPVLPADDEKGWQHITRFWGKALNKDLERKYREKANPSFEYIRAMALELLTGDATIDSFALKQFRDALDTDHACYQALVHGRQRINRLYEIHEVEDSVHVHIKHYPTQPISDILGLISKRRHLGEKGAVEVFEAIRPFWLRADITQEINASLYERAGTSTWTPTCNLGRPLGNPQRNVMPDLDEIDHIHKPDMGTWLDVKSESDSATCVTAQTLTASIEKVSPAAILDMILSRQWGRPEQERRPQNKADYCLRVDSVGPLHADTLFPENERSGNYWPRCDDQAMELSGLFWRMRDDALRIINEFDSQDRPKPDLPRSFLEAEEPLQWTQDELEEILIAILALVEWSRDRYSENVMQSLFQWAEIARGYLKPQQTGVHWVSVSDSPPQIPANSQTDSSNQTQIKPRITSLRERLDAVSK